MWLVSTAAAKWMASTRCSASPTDETSIAQARSPPSAMSRRSRCSSGASGVVRSPGRSSSPTTVLTVPIIPQGRPDAASISRSRYAVVVLPLVPVIPTTSSSAEGSP